MMKYDDKKERQLKGGQGRRLIGTKEKREGHEKMEWARVIWRRVTSYVHEKWRTDSKVHVKYRYGLEAKGGMEEESEGEKKGMK